MSATSITAVLGIDATGIQRGLSSASAQMSAFAAKVGPELAAAFSLGAVTSFANAILEMAGDLQDASDSLGIGVEKLQELQFTFGQSGVKAEVLNKGLLDLTKSLEDAKNGSANTIANFEKLGVSWEAINELTPDQVLLLMADRMKEGKNPTEELAAACEVLGKAGYKMTAGLKAGSDSIKELSENAAKLSREDVQALDDFGDKMGAAWNRIKIEGAKFGLHMLTGKAPTWGDILNLSEPQTEAKANFHEGPAGPNRPEEMPEDPRIQQGKDLERSMANLGEQAKNILAGENGKALELNMKALGDEARDALKYQEELAKGEEERLAMEVAGINYKEERKKKELEEGKALNANMEALGEKGQAQVDAADSAKVEARIIAAQISGNKDLSEELQTRLDFSERIRDAEREGNTELAKQLGIQQALTLQQQARDKEIKKELQTPQQARNERASKRAQERAGRAVDARRADRIARGVARPEDIPPADGIGNLASMDKPGMFTDKNIIAAIDKLITSVDKLATPIEPPTKK